MEYQVPQFIEVEDKIFGPLTWKQFVFIGGGIGLAVIIFLYLPFLIAVVLDVLVIAFSVALAFYKINNKSFVDILGAGFAFYTKGRLYLWKRVDKEETAVPVQMAPTPTREKLSLSGNKLHDLALSLDIQDRDNPADTSE
ncbi:MAG: seg [Parcubacteria group bacterium]|nr:seg [Parcubacteria group bacterium]